MGLKPSNDNALVFPTFIISSLCLTPKNSTCTIFILMHTILKTHVCDIMHHINISVMLKAMAIETKFNNHQNTKIHASITYLVLFANTVLYFNFHR